MGDTMYKGTTSDEISLYSSSTIAEQVSYEIPLNKSSKVDNDGILYDIHDPKTLTYMDLKNAQKNIELQDTAKQEFATMDVSMKLSPEFQSGIDFEDSEFDLRSETSGESSDKASQMRSKFNHITLGGIIYLTKSLCVNVVIIILYIVFTVQNLEPGSFIKNGGLDFLLMSLFCHGATIVFNILAVIQCNNSIILANIVYLAILTVNENRVCTQNLKYLESGKSGVYVKGVFDSDLTSDQLSAHQSKLLSQYTSNGNIAIAIFALQWVSFLSEIIIFVFFIGKWNTLSLLEKSENLAMDSWRKHRAKDLRQALNVMIMISTPLFYLSYLLRFRNEPFYYFAIISAACFIASSLLYVFNWRANSNAILDAVDIGLTTFNFFLIVQLLSRILISLEYQEGAYIMFYMGAIFFTSLMLSNFVVLHIWSKKDDRLVHEDDYSIVEEVVSKEKQLFLGLLLGSTMLFNFIYIVLFFSLQEFAQWMLVAVLNLFFTPVIHFTMIARSGKNFSYRFWGTMCLAVIQFCLLIGNFSTITHLYGGARVFRYQCVAILGILVYSACFSGLVIIGVRLLRHSNYLRNLGGANNFKESESATSEYDSDPMISKCADGLVALLPIGSVLMMVFATLHTNVSMESSLYEKIDPSSALCYFLLITGVFQFFIANLTRYVKKPKLFIIFVFVLSIVTSVILAVFTAKLAKIMNKKAFIGFSQIEMRFQTVYAALGLFVSVYQLAVSGYGVYLIASAFVVFKRVL